MKARALLLTALLSAFLLPACRKTERPEAVRYHTYLNKVNPDSLLREAYLSRNYDRILALAGELQDQGAISEIKACYWKGYAYNRQRLMRMAEIQWTHAVSLPVKNAEDLDYYARSANRLTGLLYLKFDYENCIRLGLQAMALMQQRQYTENTDYANILAFMGNCQLRLGQHEKARDSYVQADELYQRLTAAPADISVFTASVVGLVAINEAHLQTREYEDAYAWTRRLEEMLALYRSQPHTDAAFLDKEWARLHYYRACALEGLEKPTEAYRDYLAAEATAYAKTGDGKMEASKYLILARRWGEAADKLSVLEDQSSRYDLRPTLDNIQSLMVPKFQANWMAGRTSGALDAAQMICEALDTAIVRERRDAAMELSMLYDLRQKDAQVARETARLARDRFLSVLLSLAFLLLLAFLVIYYRQRSAMRLERAFERLEEANEQARESSRMKSDFIQQVSHEIRTPLNILNGFSQILTAPGVQLDDDSREDIKRQMAANTGRITGLINKMLELSDSSSRAVIPRTQTVSPLQIAAIATDASGVSTSEYVVLDMQITPAAEKVELLTDKAAAARALTLVMDNARKFSAPAEGPAAGSAPKRVSLHVDADAQWVSFTVEDDGIGIPADKAEYIFGEFIQLDNFYDGVGIGLPVARSLARRLGGNLVLDTTYKGGARFVYTLPVQRVVDEIQLYKEN